MWEVYEQLPFNTKYLFDVIVRNVQFKASDAVPPVIVDIGITIDDEFNPLTRQTEAVAKVADVGDLHTYGAFQDVDAAGWLSAGRK